jgi:hypothetical protein
MNWNTLYIKGKPGFEREVDERLTHAAISVMPGSFLEGENTALFWVDENTSLREIKKAIGSKVVFKYRLQFYKSLEEVNAVEKAIEQNFTVAEEDLIKKMTMWRSDKVRYRNSA